MSEYAVNRQTGEVLKRDQSGSWQKVKSAKNASGEILINEGSGWGAIPTAAPTPTSPFLQRAQGMLPEGTQPIAPVSAPRVGKEAALDARNAQIRERQDLAGKAAKAIKDVQDIQRKRRVEPVERAAGTVGRAKLDQGITEINPNVYLGPGSEFMLPPDAQRGLEAERQVFREADVTSSLDAATIQGINAILAGVPGIVNKDFRGELAAASNDQPGASLGGQAIGFLAPAAAGWSATARGINALARPFIPRGADAASRLARYSAPTAGQVAGAAATNAASQAGVAEPIRAEQAGEDLTLAGMGEAAQRGLTDPLNALPLALSGVNRTWNLATSGIATPSARAADMANRFGVGPRQTPGSQGIAQTTQMLGGQLQPADIRGLTNIENALRFALRDNPNIPDVNARIATGFQRIRESLPLEDDPTLNLARLIEREFAPDAPQTRDIIRNFLRGVGLNSPGGAQIVGGAANRMRGEQADILRTDLETEFGAQPRAEANAAIQQSLDQFSQAYNNVLASAPREGRQVDRALEMLNREPQTYNILDDVAQSRNQTVDQFIQRNPLEALHLVQSELAQQARSARASGADAGPLELTVRNMQRPLRDAVPGYGDLQGLWRQWTQARERMGYVRGAEAGTGGELTQVPGFGERLIGAGGVKGSEMGTQAAADLYLQMDDLSQRAAGLSVRDVISDELRKMKAAGIEQRYATPARMAQVATEGGLDALRRVFGETGNRIARRIEQFIDANEFARNIDPEFNSATMNKAQAMATGAQPFASGLGQRAQGVSNAMTESAVADAVLMLSGAPPIISAMRAPGIVGKMLQPGQRTQRNIAQTLLRRGEIGSQVPPRPPGPAPIVPIDPANVPRGGTPPPDVPPTPPAGGTPPTSPAPRRRRTVGVAPAAAAPVPAPAPVSPVPESEWQWPGPIPKEPQGLLGFVRQKGGIKEEFGRFREQGYMAGTVRQILGDVRSRPGLLNNKSGQTIDELTRSARDAGFDIRDDEEFVRLLADELQGRGKSYRIGEAEEWNIYQQFLREQGSRPGDEEAYSDIPFGMASRNELSNAAVGAGIGAAGPAETPEERARNIVVGAGLGYGGTKLGAMGRRTVGAEPTTPAGGYFNRQSMRLPGVGPTAREAELAQSWRETTPIVQTARTAASSGEQAADIAVQSRAPGDIARAKDAKAALIREIETAQALRAGMDTPEDARLADALEALRENTSDPVLLSTQIGAAKTSLERLLTDLGRPTMPSTMMRAPQRPPLRRTFSAEEESRLAPEAPEPLSRTRYAEGETPPVKGMGFGAAEPPKPVRDARIDTSGWRVQRRMFGSDESSFVLDANGNRAGLVPLTANKSDADIIAEMAKAYEGDPVAIQKAQQAGYQGADKGESQEWLSAIRKGLKMDQASRLSRAREQGYNTDTVYYHGTDADISSFRTSRYGTFGEGVYLDPDPAGASHYAQTQDGGNVLPVYVKGKIATVDDVPPKLSSGQDIADWAYDNGFAGYLHTYWPGGSKELVVFDPKNIRSVHAAFDPEKAGSSTLLAAAPFAAVGGVGAGAAMGDTEQKRTVGRPRANQEKRTVGRPAQ